MVSIRFSKEEEQTSNKLSVSVYFAELLINKNCFLIIFDVDQWWQSREKAETHWKNVLKCEKNAKRIIQKKKIEIYIHQPQK